MSVDSERRALAASVTGERELGAAVGSSAELAQMIQDTRVAKRITAWRSMTWEEQRDETRRKFDEATCPVCGGNLVEAGAVSRTGWSWPTHSRTFCSGACRQKAYRQRVTAERAARGERNGATDEEATA